MEKLIPMTDFVLEQKKKMNAENEPNLWGYLKVNFRYAEFLKQSLTLGMFIPCDKDGRALKEPERYEQRNSFDEVEMDFDVQELYEYIQAKEKVLFKGFVVDGNYLQKDEIDIISLESLIAFDIDHMTTWGEEIELTESALKQIRNE